MNREIKFRAWDKNRCQMFTDQKWAAFKVSNTGILSAVNYDRSGNNQDLVIMQSTGLTDSDGVDIYEGDNVYIAGYGMLIIEFPFLQLYEAAAEKDIGAINGNVFDS